MLRGRSARLCTQDKVLHDQTMAFRPMSSKSGRPAKRVILNVVVDNSLQKRCRVVHRSMIDIIFAGPNFLPRPSSDLLAELQTAITEPRSARQHHRLIPVIGWLWMDFPVPLRLISSAIWTLEDILLRYGIGLIRHVHEFESKLV